MKIKIEVESNGSMEPEFCEELKKFLEEREDTLAELWADREVVDNCGLDEAQAGVIRQALDGGVELEKDRETIGALASVGVLQPSTKYEVSPQFRKLARYLLGQYERWCKSEKK